jgi:hypothetical protein
MRKNPTASVVPPTFHYLCGGLWSAAACPVPDGTGLATALARRNLLHHDLCPLVAGYPRSCEKRQQAAALHEARERVKRSPTRHSSGLLRIAGEGNRFELHVLRVFLFDMHGLAAVFVLL